MSNALDADILMQSERHAAPASRRAVKVDP